VAGTGATNVSFTILSNGVTQFDGGFQAEYSSSGSISSLKGVTKLSFQTRASGMAELEGRGRTISVAANYILTIDARTNRVTGHFVQRTSATGLGSIVNSGFFVPALIPNSLGDGSWTLVLNFAAPMGNTLTGTASVTFGQAGSQVYAFNFTGKFTPNTGKSILNLKGQGAAQSSLLQVTLDDSNAVLRALGRISGQTVNFVSQ
jgi:hypothetical protein